MPGNVSGTIAVVMGADIPVNVWVTIALVLGVVVALALWLGRGLIIKKDKEGYSVQVEKNLPPDTRADTIKVAEALEIKDAEAGNIIGRQDAAGDRVQNIDVASHAKVERTKMGDIIGIQQKDPIRPDEEKKG
jgi:hypothetical protein